METSRSPLLPFVPPFLLLDAWRGAAALWVVMVHSCFPYLYNRQPELADNPLYSFSLLGQLGVVMFFVISGYCITGAAWNCIARNRPVTGYLVDRFRRIYPPYFVAIALAVGVTFFTQFLQQAQLLPQSNHPPHNFPTDLATWSVNLTLVQMPLGQHSILPVAWSLSYEVFFYLIIGAFLCIGLPRTGLQPRHRFTLLSIGAGSITILSLSWLCAVPSTTLFPFDLWYQFGLGSLLFAHATTRLPGSGRLFARTIQILLAVSIGLTLLYAYRQPSQVTPGNDHVISNPSISTQALTAAAFTLLLLGLGSVHIPSRSQQWLQPLSWMGTISYSVYLTHLTVIPFPSGALRRLGFLDDRYWVTFLGQIFVAFAFGWIFHRFVERRFLSPRQRNHGAIQSPPSTVSPPA